MKNLRAILLLTVALVSILVYSQAIKVDAHNSAINKSNIEISEDIVISIDQNAISLGQQSEIDFAINITNVCSDTLYNININVNSTSSDINIAPNSLSQAVLDIEDEIFFHTYANIIDPTTIGSTSVDLVLCIDSSGSMGEEIVSVQSELTEIITTLEVEIPDLRIGAISYGWNKYSEYPMSSENNYIPLTTDFINLKEFIDTLYASGGVEPWGDALYLANTWEWRDEANKLVIMIGDEDCDPGRIVGSESSSTVYNGTELFSVVNSLKEKGVVINTVVTENPDRNVEEQFQWISSYTEGKSVYLPEIESAADPMSLPDLIQEWTLELSREFSHWIKVFVCWTDMDGNNFYNTAEAHFWLDLASPSILHFESIKSAGEGNYNVEIIAEVKDFSNITNVAIYHNAEGIWSVESMDYSEKNSVYLKTFLNLPLNFNLTFFIEAVDIHGNVGSSLKHWLLVMPAERKIGENNYLFLNAEETEETLFSSQKDDDYYLWVKSSENKSYTLTVQNIDESTTILNPTQIVELDYYENGSKLLLYKFEMQNKMYTLLITANDNISHQLSIEYCWLEEKNAYDQSVEGIMTEEIRKTLYKWEVTECGYLYIDYTPYSDLVVKGDVYYENWTYMGNITISNFLNITTSGTYYVIIHGILRTGDYRVIINEEQPYVTDMYYNASNASGFEFTIFPFVMFLFFIRSLILKKRER